MALGAAALLSSVIAVAPAQAQSYGGGTVDCYIGSISAPSPMQSGKNNTIIARGGNNGTIAGNCHISGSIQRTGGGYHRDFRALDMDVAKGGTFEVHYSDAVNKTGEYTIQVCAAATGPNATNPANDCKTIVRNAVAPSSGGTVDCYIASVTAPSPMQSGQTNTIVAKGGNHGTANGTCSVTGSIKRTGGGYNRNFRTLTLSVAKNGKFEVRYTDSAKKTGKYTIQVCAAATGANATHPADDCKSITRNAV